MTKAPPTLNRRRLFEAGSGSRPPGGGAAEESRAEESRAEESRAEESRAEESRAPPTDALALETATTLALDSLPPIAALVRRGRLWLRPPRAPRPPPATLPIPIPPPRPPPSWEDEPSLSSTVFNATDARDRRGGGNRVPRLGRPMTSNAASIMSSIEFKPSSIVASAVIARLNRLNAATSFFSPTKSFSSKTPTRRAASVISSSDTRLTVRNVVAEGVTAAPTDADGRGGFRAIEGIVVITLTRRVVDFFPPSPSPSPSLSLSLSLSLSFSLTLAEAMPSRCRWSVAVSSRSAIHSSFSRARSSAIVASLLVFEASLFSNAPRTSSGVHAAVFSIPRLAASFITAVLAVSSLSSLAAVAALAPADRNDLLRSFASRAALVISNRRALARSSVRSCFTSSASFSRV
eukprot:30797-Pelagococcus_subviridis.AAC.1